ncbi:MAG: hypothetical protein ACLP8S_32440 [Solirubrobacteraceae bacterium]
MTTVQTPSPLPPLLRIPVVREFRAPGWFERLPRWAGTGGVLLILLLISGYVRARNIDGQLWSDEANTVGIASHPLSAIPGILWQGGGAPLYYMLLHSWMSAFGSTETSTHGLSWLFGLLTIPCGMWAGWSLSGRRAGYMAAALFAFDGFLTEYAAETRMYELLALLGLIAIASFVHAFVYRRRAYLVVFAASLALLLYTDDCSALFYAGTLVALIPVYVASGDRRGVLRDGLLVFAGAALAYLPWLPTLIHQATHATAPWRYAPLLGASFPRVLFGSDRVLALLVLAAAVGLAPLLFARLRRSRETVAVFVLACVPVAAAVLALLATLAAPTMAARYFAPVVGSAVLLAAVACARAGIVGPVAIVLTCAFLLNAASFVPQYKSDMRDVSGELASDLRPRDLVLVAQPEQAALAWYYLPGGLRYATTLGADTHPSYMDWDSATARLTAASPSVVFRRVIDSLAPGQRVMFVRPLTEGALAWRSTWAMLVRRRAAQWGALLAADPSLVQLPRAQAPHNYRGSCCVASAAVIYVKR